MDNTQVPGLQIPLVSASQESSIDSKGRFSKDVIFAEAKKQLQLAGPLMSVNLLLYILQLISVMFVGHVGDLALSGASMATSFATVTGFSFLIGMGSTLDTFCGQSYGAKQYHMVGIHTQRAMFVLQLACIPLACIWANAGHILAFLGQDPEISAEAGVYARFMIPSLFACAFLQCQFRFLQTQSIVLPMMLASGFTALLHIPICWFLVFRCNLGNKGAALANGISYWINDLCLALYIKFSPSCHSTWTGFSRESLYDLSKFLRLAVPSVIMNCLNTLTMIYMIPLGLSGSTSVRVSNELGAGNPLAARLAVCVAVVMAATESILAIIMLISRRRIWGYCFSNEERIVKYIAEMMLLLAVTHLTDGIQSVLNGVARGCGWQKIGAIVNLGAYYLIGIPLGVTLAFVYRMGGKGL